MARTAKMSLERQTTTSDSHHLPLLRRVAAEGLAGKGHRKVLQGVLYLTGTGSGSVSLGKTPGAELGASFYQSC